MRKLVQAGVIPFRHRDGDLEVLLISSRSSGDWIVPKGMIDPGLTPQQAALQEAEEEAGVRGRLSELIGYVETAKARIAVYPLEVESELEAYLEKGMRRRRWFRAKEAAEKVRDRDLGSLIRHLRRLARLQTPPAG
ncbi:MAG: NUDIX domain-containing protein [Candidatus Eremiobacteraeota bacterium]|nr:NUDIX domain-containing protein [Candidatus Eremiobacteraeota bacterium]